MTGLTADLIALVLAILAVAAVVVEIVVRGRVEYLALLGPVRHRRGDAPVAGVDVLPAPLADEVPAPSLFDPPARWAPLFGPATAPLELEAPEVVEGRVMWGPPW